MMKKVTLLMLLCCAFVLPAFAQFSNVPVTGFNADIVADGAVGAASFSTNAGADLGTPPYVFVSSTFNPGSGICATGATALPANNQITSTNTTTGTGITYTLQSYGNGTALNNNVLLLPVNGTGTLTVTTPIQASKLYLVCMGGSAGVNYTMVVNFTDATSQTITNGLQMPDWCGGASTYRLTAQSYYRILNNATSCTGATCQYLYEIPVNIAGSNFFKNISSITLTNNTTGSLMSVFAIGAQAHCTAPANQATALTLTPNTTSQISGSFTAATSSPSGYVVVRYPQGSAVTVPDHGTTYTVGQSLGLGTIVSVGTGTTFVDAGLSGGTNYTYYVYDYATGTTCGGPVYNLVSPTTATQSTSACGTLTGTVQIGPGLPNTPAGGFTSLTNALTYITANGLGGNTVLELQSGYIGTSANETFPITFPLNPCISASRTLTIRPATGVTGLSITNLSDAAPVIDFNGATYVTINGVNNGLTISNTSVASTANTSTIRFQNDARNNSILNCSVLGSSTGSLSTNNGTIYFATGTTTGNDNNTISGCKIGAVTATTLPSKGIYSSGSTTSQNIANSGNTVTNNEISDFFLTGGTAGVYVLSGNTDWTITNNKIFQTATRTFTATGTMYGVYVSSATFGQNFLINGNTIGYASAAATGTLTLDGTVAGAFNAIYYNGMTAATVPTTMNNNIVSAISLTSSSGTWIGIYNAMTSAGTNVVNISNNQVTNIATITTTGDVRAIWWTTAGFVTVNGNTVNNISRTGTGVLTGLFSGSGSVTETINNNIVSTLSSTSTGQSTIYGIYQNTAAGTKLFQNNQVFNLSGAGGTVIYGIRVGYGTTIDVNGNTVYGLASTGGTTGHVWGIYTGTSGTTFNVYRNKVYNLTTSSTNGVVYGIWNGTSAANIYNNLVGDLSSSTFTSATAPYLGIAGIYINSGNCNVYNNTVRFDNVTSTGANFSAAGIYVNTANTVALLNNLVVSLAVPTGLGKNVAHMRSSTTLTTYAAASNTNSFFTSATPSATNVIFWDGTNVYQDLASYKTAMGTRDQFTLNVNPAFVSIAGANAGYLHIPAGGSNPLESAGTNVALFTNDFDGDARPGPTGSANGGAIYYDIGADEFDAVPVFTCVQPAPGNTIASPQTLCLGSATTLSLQNPTPGNAVLYKWFSSTNGTTYTEITGATNPTYTVTPAVTTYYRATVTCGGTLTATSNPVMVTFVNNVTATTPAQRCGTGTLSLAAAASSGTLKWYASQTLGAPLGTGSPFVTPSISATTTYYVSAESTSPATLTLGAGATVGSNFDAIFYHTWGGNQCQFMVRASELQALGLSPGDITSLGINMNTVTTATYAGFAVSIGSTTNTDMSGGLFNGTLNQVYSSASYSPTTGINTFPFILPFNWDGASNIIIKFCWSNNNSSGTSNYAKVDNPGFVSSAYYRADNLLPAAICAGTTSTSTSSNRPQFLFGGALICSSPRQAVVATVNTAPAFTVTPNQTVCNNAITPLTVTSPNANYNSYVWTPVTNLFTDAAATVPYVAGASAATVYFRSNTAAVSTYTVNAANSVSQCASVTTTAITVLPSAAVAIGPSFPICLSGAATLTLTPSTGYGAGTFQWQSSADNSTFVDVNGATSATFITPLVTSTTYYRATIKSSAGAACFNSVSDTVIVNNPVLTSTTPAQRCGTGTLSLAAAASSGTVKWYTGPVGSNAGPSVATGSPFVTPSISATTNYYVSAETSSPITLTMGTGTSATGTTSYPNPMSAYYGGTKHQMLYLASELNAQGLNAGTITTVSFDLATVNTGAACNDWTIRLGNTTATSMTGFVSGTTTVYNATYTPTVTGLATFTLTTPFYWDGSSNLVLETVHNAANGGNGSGTTHKYTTTPFTSVYVRYTDNVTPAGVASFDATTAGNLTSSANRPNVVFTGSSICSTPRVVVTATVNTAPVFSVTGSQTVCNNAITPLTVTSPTANYTSYVWTPVTNLFTDAAATIPYVAGANAATVYFKSNAAAATTYTASANNTTTQCAAVATVTATVLPATATAIATPSSLCFTGTTTLVLVPATGYGAATYQWQSSSNNTAFVDVNGATAATYTTPVTTTSTYYRATIRNSAGAVCFNSASDTARVYAPAVASTTPAARCGPGTLTLGATAVDGTPKWFAASTGGTALGSGNSFTTPSISATTTYYVGTENAPTIVAPVGTGSTTQNGTGLTPFSQTWEGIRTQFLVLAADLTTAGMVAGPLNAVSFNVSTKSSTLPYTNYTIKVGTTANANLSTGYVTAPMTTVYGPTTMSTVAGANNFNFASPVTWDGTSNVLVEVCYANDPTASGTFWTSNDAVTANTTSYVSTYGQYADDNNLCGASTGSVVSASVIPRMTFTQLGCMSTRTPVVATVNPLPVPTITPAGPVNICQGQTTTLTGGGGGTYQWRNAAGNINGATNSTYTTGNAGVYKVVVTTPATGCTDSSVAVTVNVNPIPVVNLGNDTTFCSGNSLTLNAGNAGSTYLWNNGSTLQTRTVNTTGNYWVRVTNATGCQKADTILVTVNPTPVVNLGNDTNLCQGVNLVLNSGNPGATRLWDNGTTGQTRTVTSTGTYYVRVTNAFNCSGRDTIVTTFFPTPSVNLGPDVDACAGSTVTLDAGNPGESFLWDNNTTQQTRVVSTTGTYYVRVSNTANCRGRDTVVVTFHPLPVVNLGNDTAFCYGNVLTLNAGNPGASYLWNTNSTNQTIDVSTTGNYNVVVTDIYNCVGSDNINILVKDPPSGTINAVYGNAATYTFNLLNTQYVTGVTWNFGDGSPVVGGYMVQHTYANNGIYTVTANLQGECADSLVNARTVDVFDAAGGNTGINQVDSKKELVMYPNPARDLVTIENKKDYKMQQITLYSVVGQQLSSTKADSPDKHKLNITGLASGIYTVRIETDKGTVIRKFEIAK